MTRRLLYREVSPVMARIRERRNGYVRHALRSVSGIRMRLLSGITKATGES